MRIAAIVGSIRKDSYNLKLAKYVQNRYTDRFELEILNIRELPYYDQDIEKDPPSAVKEFKRKVADADAVLWVTPEYNYSIPGELKNVIDWLSRVDQVMIGKPSWLMGASMGMLGTVRGQGHLRDILFSPGISSPIMQANEIYMGAAHQKFDAAGDLADEATVKILDANVENFLNWFDRQSGSQK